MKKTFFVWSALIFATLLLFAASGFPVTPTRAQDNQPRTQTPLPSPVNNGGKAKWKVRSNTFESHFPRGFSFELDATSSAGKIAYASIVWRHSPQNVVRNNGTINDDGTITYNWRAYPNELPQWVGVEYWWMLTDEANNTYETPHQYNEYADTRNKWNRDESDDMIVFTEKGLPSTLSKTVLRAVKERREFYLQHWGTLLNYRPRVIIYRSEETWLQWAPDKDESILGETSADWGGTVQYYRGSIQELAYGIVLHEIGHLYQSQNGGNYHSQIWFYEGDASIFEKKPLYNYLARARELAREGDLPTLQDLGPSRDDRVAYDVGYAFWTFLDQEYASDAHLKVWTLIGQGTSNFTALEEVTGKPFYDLEVEFRTWLGMKNPAPPTLIPTPTLLFPPTRDPFRKKTPQP